MIITDTQLSSDGYAVYRRTGQFLQVNYFVAAGSECNFWTPAGLKCSLCVGIIENIEPQGWPKGTRRFFCTYLVEGWVHDVNENSTSKSLREIINDSP